jgi:hypothetical protein
VTAQYDNTVEVWDLRSRKRRATYRAHSRPVRAVASRPTVRLGRRRLPAALISASPEKPTERRRARPVQITGFPGPGVWSRRASWAPEVCLGQPQRREADRGLNPSFRASRSPMASDLMAASHGRIRFFRVLTGRRFGDCVEASYVSRRAFPGWAALFSCPSVNSSSVGTCRMVCAGGVGRDTATDFLGLTRMGRALTSGCQGVLLRDPAWARERRCWGPLNIYAVAAPRRRCRGRAEQARRSLRSFRWAPDLAQAHENQVWSVSITFDGRYAVSAGTDRMLSWDPRPARRSRAMSPVRASALWRLPFRVHGDVDFRANWRPPGTITGSDDSRAWACNQKWR